MNVYHEQLKKLTVYGSTYGTKKYSGFFFIFSVYKI